MMPSEELYRDRLDDRNKYRCPHGDRFCPTVENGEMWLCPECEGDMTAADEGEKI